MGDEFEIREMNEGDIGAVMGIEREVFTFPWRYGFFERELGRVDTAIYRVAVTGSKITGFIGANLFGEEVHITNMAVEPGARRRGLGTALLVDCVQLGIEKGARWLTLEVRETNHDARAFYRIFGLRELGLRRRYYSDTGEDAVIMAAGDIRGGFPGRPPAGGDGDS